jgi:hypothetical protein
MKKLGASSRLRPLRSFQLKNKVYSLGDCERPNPEESIEDIAEYIEGQPTAQMAETLEFRKRADHYRRFTLKPILKASLSKLQRSQEFLIQKGSASDLEKHAVFGAFLIEIGFVAWLNDIVSVEVKKECGTYIT